MSYGNKVSMAFWQINTHCWDPWSEKSRPYFYFILFYFNGFFGFHVFFFFLSFFFTDLRQRPFFFLLLHSFSFFSSSHKHMGNFIKKKKKHMGTNFSNQENQTHKHMIPIIHTNKQTQTHKHVHPHNKSKIFFSKHKQNPEVRNKREERGGDQCCYCPSEVILQARYWWRSMLGEVEIGAK